MDKYYSIGEMAKRLNISVQTLRYYEKIDLFKPAYIDPVSKYRYYSEFQFHYLDMIKSLKFLGVPLEKIKEAQQLNPEQLLQFMEKQDQVIMKKINELEEIRLSLKKSTRLLKEQLEIPWFSEIYEKELEEEKILKINAENASPTYIPDQYFTALFKTIEVENSMLNSRYGCMYSMKQYSSVDDIAYHTVFVPLLTDRKLEKLESNVQLDTIPASRYICIAFEINYEAAREANYKASFELYMSSYQKLFTYIKEHNRNVKPIVYEILMPNNYSPNEQVQFIMELRVACTE